MSFPFFVWVYSVTQLCPALWDPVDYSLPDSSVHGIFQARTLEGIAISSFRDLPNTGIKPASPALAGRFFTTVPPGKPPPFIYLFINLNQQRLIDCQPSYYTGIHDYHNEAQIVAEAQQFWVFLTYTIIIWAFPYILA